LSIDTFTAVAHHLNPSPVRGRYGRPHDRRARRVHVVAGRSGECV